MDPQQEIVRNGNSNFASREDEFEAKSFDSPGRASI
jgi:hypothetical protein